MKLLSIDKALVKKTNNIYDIKFHYKTNDVSSYYILSDGKKYLNQELVIGHSAIRDWKIKKII